MLVQVVLKREGGRARAVGRKGRAAPVEFFVRWWHDDDRHPFARDEGQSAIRGGEIVEAEGFLQEGANEAPGRLGRRICDLGEGIKMGLADAEGGRDFLADRQALANAVVEFRLL